MSVLVWLYHGIQWTWGGTPFRSPATGYNIVSGDLGDLFVLGFVASMFRKHNCHVRGCWRIAFHPHNLHGHPVCRPHYGESGEGHVVG